MYFPCVLKNSGLTLRCVLTNIVVDEETKKRIPVYYIDEIEYGDGPTGLLYDYSASRLTISHNGEKLADFGILYTEDKMFTDKVRELVDEDMMLNIYDAAT